MLSNSPEILLCNNMCFYMSNVITELVMNSWDVLKRNLKY